MIDDVKSLGGSEQKKTAPARLFAFRRAAACVVGGNSRKLCQEMLSANRHEH